MLLRAALLSTMVCSGALALAQAPFINAYKDPAFTHNYSHNYAQVAQHPSGGVVMVIDLSETINDRYIYAMRCSASGAVQWMQRIAVTGSELWDVTDMALAPDGSIVITGTDGLHGLFLRLDPTGVPVAAKWYSWTGNSAATTLRVLNDSNIVIFGNNRQGSISRGWTVLVNADGELLTTATNYQVDGFELAAVQVLPVPANATLLFGRSDVYGSPPDIGVAIAKVDSLGALTWGMRISSAGLQLRPVGAMVLPDSSMRLVVRNDGGFSSQSTIMIALSSTGGVQWMQELHPQRGTWDMTPLSAAPMSTATLAITGYYDPAHSGVLLIDTAASTLDHVSWDQVIIAGEGYGDIGGELVLAAHTPVSGSFDPMLLRTYPDLHICTSAATSNSVNGITLDVTSAYTTGSQSLSVVDVLPDFQATAISPTLNEMCVTVGMAPLGPHLPEALLIPNPASDRLTISGRNIEQVDVIDATGRALISGSFRCEGVVDIDIHHLPAGLYQVRLRTSEGWSESKLMKD